MLWYYNWPFALYWRRAESFDAFLFNEAMFWFVVWRFKNKSLRNWTLLDAHLQNCEKRLLASSYLSVCPSVPMELASHWKDFHEVWCFCIFAKICRGNSSFIIIWQEKWVLYMKTSIHFFILSRSGLLRMRNVSDKGRRENQNTHFVFSNFFR